MQYLQSPPPAAGLYTVHTHFSNQESWTTQFFCFIFVLTMVCIMNELMFFARMKWVSVSTLKGISILERSSLWYFNVWMFLYLNITLAVGLANQVRHQTFRVSFCVELTVNHAEHTKVIIAACTVLLNTWAVLFTFICENAGNSICCFDIFSAIHLPAHSRRNVGLWYSNGLHHLWCCTPSCYTINNTCTCRLCGERQPTKFHLLSCRTSTLARHIVITPVNVNKLVNVLYVI